jgi:hypothetical protein
MVPAAQALPIGRIESRTAVPALSDVIGEEPGRRAHFAPNTILDMLAAVSGTLQDIAAPCPVFRRQQIRIGKLRSDLDRARVERSDDRRKRSQLRHIRTGRSACALQ